MDQEMTKVLSFQPYEGREPYIFISYAHANAPAVLQIVQELHDQGYRIWYDDGIEVGSEWQENIADHLAGASLMIAFISNAYVRSDNCRKEVSFALSRRIPSVNIFLEEAKMTPGMELQIGNLFALMKYTMSEEKFYGKLLTAPQLTDDLRVTDAEPVRSQEKNRKKKPTVPIDLTVEEKKQKKRKRRRLVRFSVLALLVIAAAVLVLVGHFTGLTERMIVLRRQEAAEQLAGTVKAEFTDPLLEAAAREYTGISEGEICVADLAGMTGLTLCGNSCAVEDAEPEEIDGAEGTLADLSELRYFTGLTKLTLIDQPITSLETLPAGKIEYLRIENAKITSLQGIGRQTHLREIDTVGCPVRDLGDLKNCLQLRRLSLLDAAVTDFTPVKPLTKLAEVEISNSAINNLATVLNLSRLTDVSFYDCDLRGSFFKSFDRESRIVSLKLVDCKLDSTVNLDDFKGLTTLTLVRTGETLDWSALAQLGVLKTVYADSGMIDMLAEALTGTDVSVLPAEG